MRSITAVPHNCLAMFQISPLWQGSLVYGTSLSAILVNTAGTLVPEYGSSSLSIYYPIMLILIHTIRLNALTATRIQPVAHKSVYRVASGQLLPFTLTNISGGCQRDGLGTKAGIWIKVANTPGLLLRIYWTENSKFLSFGIPSLSMAIESFGRPKYKNYKLFLTIATNGRTKLRLPCTTGPLATCS